MACTVCDPVVSEEREPLVVVVGPATTTSTTPTATLLSSISGNPTNQSTNHLSTHTDTDSHTRTLHPSFHTVVHDTDTHVLSPPTIHHSLLSVTLTHSHIQSLTHGAEDFAHTQVASAGRWIHQLVRHQRLSLGFIETGGDNDESGDDEEEEEVSDGEEGESTGSSGKKKTQDDDDDFVNITGDFKVCPYHSHTPFHTIQCVLLLSGTHHNTAIHIFSLSSSTSSMLLLWSVSFTHPLPSQHVWLLLRRTKITMPCLDWVMFDGKPLKHRSRSHVSV